MGHAHGDENGREHRGVVDRFFPPRWKPVIEVLAWPEYHPAAFLRMAVVMIPLACIVTLAGLNIWQSYRPITVRIQSVTVIGSELHVQATSSALSGCRRFSDYELFDFDPATVPRGARNPHRPVGVSFDGAPYPPAGDTFQPPELAIPPGLHGRKWLVISQPYACWPWSLVSGTFASHAYPVDLP
jgi:hypothetical protein